MASSLRMVRLPWSKHVFRYLQPQAPTLLAADREAGARQQQNLYCPSLKHKCCWLACQTARWDNRVCWPVHRAAAHTPGPVARQTRPAGAERRPSPAGRLACARLVLQQGNKRSAACAVASACARWVQSQRRLQPQNQNIAQGTQCLTRGAHGQAVAAVEGALFQHGLQAWRDARDVAPIQPPPLSWVCTGRMGVQAYVMRPCWIATTRRTSLHVLGMA